MKSYKYKGYIITRHIYKVFEALQQTGAERWYEVTAPNVCGYTFASCGTIAEANNYINKNVAQFTRKQIKRNGGKEK